MTPRALSTWFYIYILCAGPKIATSSFLVFASCVVMVTDMAKNANPSQPYRRHFLDIILTQFGHVFTTGCMGVEGGPKWLSYECLHCSWLHGGFIYVTLMWCCIFRYCMMLYTDIDVMFRYQKDVADVVLLLASLDLAGFLLAVTDETYYNFNTSISLKETF